MAKDHTPGDFNRPSGYKSDLEIGETQSNIKKVNTSFGSKNHNSYVMLKNNTHEHYYYDPKNQRSGWHGANYPTRHNHPKLHNQKNTHGEKQTMEKSNAFLESIKVDRATVARCNEVGKNAGKNLNTAKARSASSEGGRERGDTGPASHGREGGSYKGGNSDGHSNGNNGHGNGNTSGAHGTNGHGGGHGNTSGGHGHGGGKH